MLFSVEAIAILQRIRRFCDRMVITGGEPTLHPGLDAILEAIPGLGFALAIDYPPSLLVNECTIFFEGVRRALSLHH
jgi:organic radical activating enzyme